MGQEAADPGTDLDDFFGGVNGSVIDVEAGRHTALVESSPQGLDEGIDILGREELAVATDPRSVIEEGNESGLDRNAVDLDVGTVEGVGLPHFIGVGFGKSQTLFVVGFGLGLVAGWENLDRTARAVQIQIGRAHV